ncbi:hypothetical protein KAR91_10325 [Candidatus Pacearchaeota archaeon]|nr:hypothetical protein [Candidatus Pacearchaeota archaeon]
MFLKIVPKLSRGNHIRMLECKRWVIRRPDDLDINEDLIQFFDVHVAEGEGELEDRHAVILRLDWNSEQAQSVIITSPAYVYVMSDSGQTVDKFGIV